MKKFFGYLTDPDYVLPAVWILCACVVCYTFGYIMCYNRIFRNAESHEIQKLPDNRTMHILIYK